MDLKMDLPLDFIKAKRREFEQRLEELLTLQTQTQSQTQTSPGAQAFAVNPVNVSPSSSGTSTPTPDTEHSNYNCDSVQRVDSSDWLALAPLLQESMPSMSVPMPPLSASAPELTSEPQSQSTSMNYVYSERLAEILPDLDVNMISADIPSAEENQGLVQFFQNADAWLVEPLPAKSGTSLCAPSKTNTTTTTTTGKRKKKTSSSSRSTKSSKSKLGRPSAFPQKLYKMLTELHNQNSNLCDIVGFVQGGAAFQIYSQEAFVTEILPKYFKMSSFSSFQRQLQLYSFKRDSKGGAYRHPLFHRDQPDNLHKMIRKQSKPSTFVLTLTAKTA